MWKETSLDTYSDGDWADIQTVIDRWSNVSIMFMEFVMLEIPYAVLRRYALNTSDNYMLVALGHGIEYMTTGP